MKTGDTLTSLRGDKFIIHSIDKNDIQVKNSHGNIIAGEIKGKRFKLMGWQKFSPYLLTENN